MAVTRPPRRPTRDDVTYVDGMTLYEVAAYSGGLMFDHPTWQVIEHPDTWLSTSSKALYIERDGKSVRLGQVEDFYASREAAIGRILAEIKATKAALDADAAEWQRQIKAKSAKSAAVR